MIAALKAEFKKLLTVRSTYFLSILVLVIVGGLSFYNGFHELGLRAHNGAIMPQPDLVQNIMFGMVQLVAVIASIVAILLLAHEYRYNTINYSLTISNSRSKVIFTKVVIVTFYAAVFAAVGVAVAFAGIYLGALFGGNSVGVQNYDFWAMVGQVAFVVWGSSIFGLILVTLIRNLVGSIVAVIFVPAVEQILGSIIFRGDNVNNVGYLPFSALHKVTSFPGMPGFSVTKSIIIVLIYMAVSGIIAWYLFLRRDAN